MATEQQIRELAYSIWEQEGRPHGKDWEHYYTARRILEERQAAAARPADQRPAPPVQGNSAIHGHKHNNRRR